MGRTGWGNPCTPPAGGGRPLRREGLIVRTLRGGRLAVHEPLGSVTHVFNRTASFIWSLCDGLHAVEDIVRSLAAHFQVRDARSLQGDVEAALHHLATKGLVVEVARAAVTAR